MKKQHNYLVMKGKQFLLSCMATIALTAAVYLGITPFSNGKNTYNSLIIENIEALTEDIELPEPKGYYVFHMPQFDKMVVPQENVWHHVLPCSNIPGTPAHAMLMVITIVANEKYYTDYRVCIANCHADLVQGVCREFMYSD